MIQVENNFLNNDTFFSIQKTISGNDFTWTLLENSPIYLVHPLILEQGKYVSNFTKDVLSDCLKILKPDVVLESNVRLFTKDAKQKEYMHPSSFLKEKKYKTFILSFNSTDGYLEITGLKKINSQENQAMMFDYIGNFVQTNPTDRPVRIIIEIFYQKS
tara:strand:+ start:277 stop:753 length:477 start_codon:yes stop_codon:yes gene_type:complete